MQREFLNVKQVQDMLGISERTVFRYIKSGELKGFKAGREWKFEPADIDAFIETRRRKAEEELKSSEPAA
jgi:excisionase family DNA binding protein